MVPCGQPLVDFMELCDGHWVKKNELGSHVLNLCSAGQHN